MQSKSITAVTIGGAPVTMKYTSYAEERRALARLRSMQRAGLLLIRNGYIAEVRDHWGYVTFQITA